MKVFFGDVAKEFVQQYFQLLADGARVEPMYSENAELQINADLVRGRSNIVAALAKLDKIAGPPSHLNHVAQPYCGDGVIITAVVASESAKFVMTYILAIVGDGNQFGITHHLIHNVP
jgi:hypothetical protein